jgi:hypothetical protein
VANYRKGDPQYDVVRRKLHAKGLAMNPNGQPLDEEDRVSSKSAKAVAAKLKEMAEEAGVDGATRVTEQAVKTFLNLTHDELNMITLIGKGFPVRNAQSILSAIKLKLDKTVAPADTGTGKEPVTVMVQVLGAPEGTKVEITPSQKELDS